MRKLDCYIARSFLAPFLVATGVILGLYIVGDAFGRLDDFLREAGGIGVALARMGKLYFLRVPTFLSPVIPVAMLLGAAYGIAQLSGRNELTAMKAIGVSLWRILAPVYAMAVLVAFLGMANREYLVPKVEARLASERSRWTGESERYERITLYFDPEETLFTMRYSVDKRHARSMSVTRKARQEHLEAAEGVPVEGGWLLKDVKMDSETVPEYLLKTSLRPSDLNRVLLDPNVCSIRKLQDLIRDKPEDRTYQLLYHSRLTYPFVGLVLVGLGLPFVIGSERLQRSRLLGVGVCVVVGVVFYTIQFIAEALGRSGHLPPALAAWLPTVIFGALGFYLLETLHS